MSSWVDMVVLGGHYQVICRSLWVLVGPVMQEYGDIGGYLRATLDG